jgi:hypothetical protein
VPDACWPAAWWVRSTSKPRRRDPARLQRGRRGEWGRRRSGSLPAKAMRYLAANGGTAFQRSPPERARTKAQYLEPEHAAAAAAVQAARAVIRESRSQYFPTITAGAWHHQSASVDIRPKASSATYSEFTMPVQASWEPDLWGRVRNTVGRILRGAGQRRRSGKCAPRRAGGTRLPITSSCARRTI